MKVRNQIKKMIQEVIRDFVPTFSEEKNTENKVLEPDPDHDCYNSDNGYSFDSNARHNLDT